MEMHAKLFCEELHRSNKADLDSHNYITLLQVPKDNTRDNIATI